MNRRELLVQAAVLAGASIFAKPAAATGSQHSVPRASRRIVAAEPWGTLEEVADGVWGMFSTPLADRTTLCNGGLIAGRDGVLMVEAFGSDAGAQWMSDRALALTGRRPTHVVCTHYHGDHTAGLRAAMAHGDVTLHLTERTRALVAERNANAPQELLAAATTIAADRETVLDLGGRRVTLRPLEGHTGSDVALWVDDTATLFAGDLVWFGMFPNFVDAVPSRLSQSVRALAAPAARTVVPGHGVRTDAVGLARFVELLDAVERAAREAQAAGIGAEEAGRAFRMPAGMEEWTLFNARYYERAIGAWLRELGAAR